MPMDLVQQVEYGAQVVRFFSMLPMNNAYLPCPNAVSVQRPGTATQLPSPFKSRGHKRLSSLLPHALSTGIVKPRELCNLSDDARDPRP